MSDRRDFEEERRVSRREAGELLRDVGERLIEEGVVEFGEGETARVPEEVELEVEFEEERYEVEFEVELEWGADEVPEEPASSFEGVETGPSGDEASKASGPGGGGAGGVSEPEPGEFLDYRPGYDETKCRMEGLVKGFAESAESGSMPGVEDFREFLALNAVFEEYAEGESYAHMMPAYGEVVEEMMEAFESGEPETFLGALREVRGEEDRCHEEYRW